MPTELACVGQTVSTVTLSWSSIEGATLYELVAGNSSSITQFPFLSMTSDTTTVTVQDLFADYPYVFKVRAHVGFDKTQMILGWTEFSPPQLCATKPTNPLVPANLRRATSQLFLDKIDIMWDAPLGNIFDTAHFTISSGGCVQLHSPKTMWKTNWEVVRTTSLLKAVVENLPSNSICRVKVAAVYNNTGLVQESEPQFFRTRNPNTTWIQTHRVTENSRADVDFLANHNSGTLQADVAFMSFQGNSSRFFDFLHSPESRFCVEIEKVNLSAIKRTPSNPAAIPM